MSNFANLFKILKGSASIIYPSFPVDDSHVIDPPSKPLQFKKDEVYFEIRICEQFLKNKREYWQEWNPLSIVLSDFIYNKDKQFFPFVVGPDLLKSIQELEGNDSVRYTNTRVVGPTPYRGDQLELFVGLFRVESTNWAKQALNLLETVAKSFDISKLTGYIKIADPIIDGIEGFLGMGDKTQLRIGKRDEFGDPETPAGSQLKPGYFVIIRDKNITKITDEYIKKFWVKKNQLYYGNDKSNLEVYTGNDYMLYQIACHEGRNDYSTFEFHSQWEIVRDAIWKDSEEKANDEYLHLINLIRRSPDLIPEHMKKLQLIYRAKTGEEIEAKKSASQSLFLGETPSFKTRSLRGLEHMKGSLSVPERTYEGILMSNKILTDQLKKRAKKTRSVTFAEKDIQEMLASDVFDKSSMADINTDHLTRVLSLETSFSNGGIL